MNCHRFWLKIGFFGSFVAAHIEISSLFFSLNVGVSTFRDGEKIVMRRLPKKPLSFFQRSQQLDFLFVLVVLSYLTFNADIDEFECTTNKSDFFCEFL